MQTIFSALRRVSSKCSVWVQLKIFASLGDTVAGSQLAGGLERNILVILLDIPLAFDNHMLISKPKVYFCFLLVTS